MVCIKVLPVIVWYPARFWNWKCRFSFLVLYFLEPVLIKPPITLFKILIVSPKRTSLDWLHGFCYEMKVWYMICHCYVRINIRLIFPPVYASDKIERSKQRVTTMRSTYISKGQVRKLLKLCCVFCHYKINVSIKNDVRKLISIIIDVMEVATVSHARGKWCLLWSMIVRTNRLKNKIFQWVFYILLSNTKAQKYWITL